MPGAVLRVHLHVPRPLSGARQRPPPSSAGGQRPTAVVVYGQMFRVRGVVYTKAFRQIVQRGPWHIDSYIYIYIYLTYGYKEVGIYLYIRV